MFHRVKRDNYIELTDWFYGTSADDHIHVGPGGNVNALVSPAFVKNLTSIIAM